MAFCTHRDRGGGGAGRAIALPLFAWVDFLGLQMTWIFYEFYHLKAIKRVYSCICTKSKARQSSAVAVMFAGVSTLPTVLPKIILEGYVMRPHILSSVLSTNALTRKSSAPVPKYRETTMSQSSSFLKHRTA